MNGNETRKMLLVSELFRTEINYYEHLSILSSFREGNSFVNVERIFLNVHGLLGLSFSLLCFLEGLLADFFRERKERRREKWEFNPLEKSREEEGGKKVIKDLREVAERFKIEINKLGEPKWLRKEEENEKEEEEERGLQIGEFYLKHFPLISKEFGLFYTTRFPFQADEVRKLCRKTKLSQSFSESKISFETCLVVPASRVARYACVISDLIDTTSLPSEKSLLQCFLSGYESWMDQFLSYHERSTLFLEKFGENMLVKEIEEFWGCLLPLPKYENCTWPYSEKVFMSEERIFQCSSILQSNPKDLIKFMNVLEGLQREALSFENKLTREGKGVTRSCDIFLEYCPCFTDFFSQWSGCFVFLVESLKKIQSPLSLEEEEKLLKPFFERIFNPLARLATYVGVLHVLDYWGDVEEGDQEILFKTLICYRQVIDITVDSFGNKKGRSIKGVSRSHHP